MYVKIYRNCTASLEDVQNFQAFKLCVSDTIADLTILTDKIPDLVHAVAGDHAWLSQDAVERLGPADADWVRQYHGMIAYAETKGWTRDMPPVVAAHIEMWPD